MYQSLIDISASLASAAPPPELTFGTTPDNPVRPVVCTGCSHAASYREGYEDMPTTMPTSAPSPEGDPLIFADDEFPLGEAADGTAAPYSDLQMAPNATGFTPNANSKPLDTVGATPPGQFRQAVGATGLGSETTVTFQTSPPAAPVVQSTTTKTQTWMPMGMSNTQALVVAIAVCTGCLLLFFIVGMNSSSGAGSGMSADPLVGL